MTSDPSPPLMSRPRFLLLAGLVQGGVLLAAILFGYAIGISPFQIVMWDARDLLWGLLAVVPMLVVYQSSPGLRRIALHSLGDSLSQCQWYDLVLLATLAGVGEELFFRGVLYEGLVMVHPWLALIASNVAFGLLHGLSWNYFLTTTAIGFGMHALAEVTGPRNLLAPIVAHSVYDYVAFRLLVREQRSDRSSERSGMS